MTAKPGSRFRFTITDRRAAEGFKWMLGENLDDAATAIFWALWRSYAEMRNLGCQPQIAFNDLVMEWNYFVQFRLAGEIVGGEGLKT